MKMMATDEWLGHVGAAFDSAAPAGPSFRYAIFSSQRTGSSYLCARLSNVKDRLGIPMEYLHHDVIRLMRTRLFPGVTGIVSLERYLQSVARIRTTRDGWFGAKIQPNQLLPLVDGNVGCVIRFLAGFDRLIFMTRHDVLRQAVSGAIAYATGIWFNFGSDSSPENINATELFPLIEHLQLQYAEEEKLIGSIVKRLGGRPLLHIAYEEVLEDPQKVFRRVVAFLEPGNNLTLEEHDNWPLTQKPLGQLAERVRAAYLASLEKSHRFE